MNILALPKVMALLKDLPAGAIAPVGFSEDKDGCLLLTLRATPAALANLEELVNMLDLDQSFPQILAELKKLSTQGVGQKEAPTSQS